MEQKKIKIYARDLSAYVDAINESRLCDLLADRLECYYGYERLISDLRDASLQLEKLAVSNLSNFEITDGFSA